MILELNSKHSLNFGEDLEYVATYVKGLKTKPDVKSRRLLFKGVKTGKEILLFLGTKEFFFNRSFIHEIEYLDSFVKISPTQLKFKVYNYYRLHYDLKDVEELFDTWRKSDPMIHVGGFQHSNISNISNYTWTYRFNGKTF